VQAAGVLAKGRVFDMPALDHMAAGIICIIIFIDNCLLLMGMVAMCRASN
jgi:hypothetical protein